MTKFSQIRKQKRLKNQVLANTIGVSKQAVCNLNRNGIRNISTAKRYAAVLGCNPQDLLEWDK